jgi:hypothetical protein
MRLSEAADSVFAQRHFVDQKATGLRPKVKGVPSSFRSLATGNDGQRSTHAGEPQTSAPDKHSPLPANRSKKKAKRNEIDDIFGF